ncbi:hypothetical protein GEMRC1_007756 [Eukaryota sp. GEM-RC1]
MFFFINEKIVGSIESVTNSLSFTVRLIKQQSITTVDFQDWSLSQLFSSAQSHFEPSYVNRFILSPCVFSDLKVCPIPMVFDRKESISISYQLSSRQIDYVAETNLGRLPSMIYITLSSQNRVFVDYSKVIDEQSYPSKFSKEIQISDNDIGGPFSLILFPQVPSLSCKFSPIVPASLIVGCSPFRKVVINHDIDLISSIDDEFIMEPLPINYRPPSRFGKGIPISDNIYNADPSQDMYFNIDGRSKSTGSYKQCEESPELERCGCSEKSRVSQYEIETDCITHVYRVFYSDGFSLSFSVLEGDDELRSIDDKFYLHELNDRRDYCFASDTSSIDCTNFDEVSDFLMSTNDTIIFAGDELYHFRATFVSESLCNYQTDFVFWVFEPPAQQTIVWATISITSITLGIVLFVLYFVFFKVSGRRFE